MKRTYKALLVTGMTMALVFAAAVGTYADDNATFVPGTTINSIGVGGMTVDAAKARIEAFYAGEYQLIIKEKNGKTEMVKGSDIGYQVSVNASLQTILDQENAAGRTFGPEVDNKYRLDMQTSFSQEALMAKIAALNIITGNGITKTANAYITPYQEGQTFKIVPEVNGNSVDAQMATALILQTVTAGGTEVDLTASNCYDTVTVTSQDQSLVNLCATMNQVRGINITYQAGEHTASLSGAELATWITGSENGQIQLDVNKASAWIAAFAATVDTAGTTRNFHTVTGKDVSLKGPYGWKINQQTELAALVNMAQSGTSQTRTPEFSSSAASWAAPEWGVTYVEIDLTGQHVYMIKDGAVVWDAQCVTGNVSKDYTTPAGIYSIAYKQRDRVLRGEKKADGTYEYESPVSYWMPFNGGIGLHDANWRSSFGGSIYQTSGSHGCVNLPPAKAALLYDLIATGTPVICYN